MDDKWVEDQEDGEYMIGNLAVKIENGEVVDYGDAASLVNGKYFSDRFSH